jgi:hypothetical protein
VSGGSVARLKARPRARLARTARRSLSADVGATNFPVLRDVDGTPFPFQSWVHQVTVDEGPGASAREIADYLGYERVSMAQDVSMPRGVTGDAALTALEWLAPPETRG